MLKLPLYSKKEVQLAIEFGVVISEVSRDSKLELTKEKVAITRTFREDQYEKLLDAVYFRRGWTPNGIPTIERLKSIGMDLPELLEIVTPLQ